MLALFRLLGALKFVFDQDETRDVKTYIPTLLGIKRIGRIVENDEHIRWMDCVISDQLPRALCLLQKADTINFQIIFEQAVRLPDLNFPLVDGLEPKIEPQAPTGACVLYCSPDLRRGIALRTLTNEVIALFAERVESALPAKM